MFHWTLRIAGRAQLSINTSIILPTVLSIPFLSLFQVGVSFDLLILGQYLAALITETYFYYWYGNELMLEVILRMILNSYKSNGRIIYHTYNDFQD